MQEKRNKNTLCVHISQSKFSFDSKRHGTKTKTKTHLSDKRTELRFLLQK